MYRLIINSVGVHMLAIFIFMIIYFSLPNNSFVYTNNKQGSPNLIDFFNLSVTTQAGVGLSNITPNTEIAILISALQQISMITKNIVMLYFFTQL
jgi:hypothetical protein